MVHIRANPHRHNNINKDKIKMGEKKRNEGRVTRAQKMRDKNAFKKKIKNALNEF